MHEVREAANQCLFWFMRNPSRVRLTEDDPDSVDLLTYLASLGTEPAEAAVFTMDTEIVDDLPEGEAVRGETVYDGACRTCHGADHTGEDLQSRSAPAARVRPHAGVRAGRPACTN